jgi:hypothetical protein
MIDGEDIAETLIDLTTDIEPDKKNPWPTIILIGIIISVVVIYYIYT